MRRLLAILLALSLALTLFGCAKQNGASVAPGTDGAAAAEPTKPEDTPQEWVYDVRLESTQNKHRNEDGVVLAVQSYELPVLQMRNAAGEETFLGDLPISGVSEEQLAVCKAFNAGVDLSELSADSDFAEASEEAYQWSLESGMEFTPLFDEFHVTEIYQYGDLLSVFGVGSSYAGGAHPNNYTKAWNFDLGTGEFFTLRDLSDYPDELVREIAYNILGKIWENDEADLYFDDYADTILMMDNFAVSFDESGMTVTFAEYDIAPHAGGMPSFLIPYAEFSRYLNERGERLLNLKPEDRALGDYYEAEEMWSWFDLTTMPLDPERPASEEGYYAVDYRDITTMAQLRTLLETRFSAEIVDELLTAESGFAHYKEIDGVLCAVQADRGSDITVASVDYAVELDGDHTAGRVIATIHRQDFDEAKEEWYLTDETETVEFPFEMTENGARFTSFESAY